MLYTHKHTSSVQNTAKNGTAAKILKHTQAFYRINRVTPDNERIQRIR